MKEFKNQFVEIHIDSKILALHVKFLAFTPFDAFKQILEYEFEMVRKYDLKRILVDLRQLPVYSVGSKEYVRDVWFPTMQRYQVQRIAVIAPETVLAQMAMQRAHKDSNVRFNFQTQYFESEEKALEWLALPL